MVNISYPFAQGTEAGSHGRVKKRHTFVWQRRQELIAWWRSRAFSSDSRWPPVELKRFLEN